MPAINAYRLKEKPGKVYIDVNTPQRIGQSASVSFEVGSVEALKQLGMDPSQIQERSGQSLINYQGALTSPQQILKYFEGQQYMAPGGKYYDIGAGGSFTEAKAQSGAYSGHAGDIFSKLFTAGEFKGTTPFDLPTFTPSTSYEEFIKGGGTPQQYAQQQQKLYPERYAEEKKFESLASLGGGEPTLTEEEQLASKQTGNVRIGGTLFSSWDWYKREYVDKGKTVVGGKDVPRDGTQEPEPEPDKPPLIPYDDTSKTIVDTDDEGLEEDEDEDRKQSILDQAESEQQELDSLTRQEQIKLKKQALGIEEPPAKPTLVSDYEALRDENGISALETHINTLEGQIRDVEASLRQGLYTSEGEIAPMELIGAEQREKTRKAQEQLDTLNRRKQTLVDELTTKNNIISNMMNLTQQDYSNAVADYNARFNQAIKLNDMVNDELDDIQATAYSNLEVVYNMAQKSGKGWTDLDPTLQSKVRQLELQAGLPAGTYETLMTTKPDMEILATTQGTNDAGESIVTFIYKDPKTGKAGTVEVVKTGGAKQASATEIQAQQKQTQWTQARTFISNNPNATYEQLETALRENVPLLSDSDIKSLLTEAEKKTTKEIEESKEFLSIDYLRSLYTEDQLKTSAKEEGFKGNKKGKEEYLNYLMNLIENYRESGYTDKEILKMMK